MSLLLIFPPFGMLQTPHLAIPALSAYLSSAGVEVSVLDANIEFLHYFLTRKRVEEGRKFAEEKMQELNSAASLTLFDQLQYMNLCSLSLIPNEVFNTDIVFDTTKTCPLEYKPLAVHSTLAAASAPFFPERIDVKLLVETVKYYPHKSKFTVDDLVDSVKRPRIFAGFFERILPDIINKKTPDIIGISVAFDDQINAALLCAGTARKLAPDAHIVLGGSFVSNNMSRISNKRIFELVDSLVIGEGEIPLKRLTEEIGSGHPDFSRVPGLIYPDGKKILRNPVAPPIKTDSLPIPDFSSFNFDRYTMPIHLMGVPFRSSRGCPWNKCYFCNTNCLKINHYEQASADYMYNAISTMADKTGADYFNFADNATDPEVLEQFSRRVIDNKLNIRWTTSLRLDKNITLERCQLYRVAGCTNLFFGLESYNDRLLKIANKGTTVKSIDSALSNASWAGIYIYVYMMVGLPTETEDEAYKNYQEILKLINKGVISKAIYNSLFLYPGSLYYSNPSLYGIRNARIPEGCDLDCIIYDYETDGMTRERSRDLAAEFSCNGQARFQQKEINLSDGKTLSLKHDLEQISRRLDHTPLFWL